MSFPVHSQDIDSLYNVFSNSRGEKQINAANEILEYAFENEYVDSLITLKTADGEVFVKANVYEAIGSYFLFEIANYEKSIDFFKLALENYILIGDASVINLLNASIGNNYARIGNYENAVEYLMKCYEWEKSENDREALSSTLNSLGVIYSQWQKPDVAIHYLEEAVYVERQLNRPLQYATRLASLSKEYTFIDVNKSLPLIKEALEYDEKIESQNIKDYYIAIHTLLMGDVYYELDSLTNAANSYKRALAFFEKVGNPYYIATSLQSLGRLQVRQHNFTEAVNSLKRCIEIAERNKFLDIQFYACLYLSEAYSYLEPNSLSHVYLKKYTLLKDSIFRETTQKQINDFQVKYETAEKQFEIERQQTEIERHRTRQLIYVSGLIVAGLLLALFAYVVVLRNRRNRVLSEMNAIKDKFFSIISHDLKNPAVAQRDALQLLAEHSDKLDSNTISSYYQNLLKSANGLVDLLKNLLNWAQIQTGRDVYRPIPFNIVAALQSDIDVIKNISERKNISFDTLIPQSAIVTADENMIVTVIRNLLTNAVKFTETGGTVTLEISNGVISVIDTGTGMTQEQLQNLFRIDRQHSKPGTANETGTGLGLIVCREMIEKHGSKLNVESEEGKGSRFWFELRIDN